MGCSPHEVQRFASHKSPFLSVLAKAIFERTKDAVGIVFIAFELQHTVNNVLQEFVRRCRLPY